jgi:uncharacterized protein YndB with AHSA1/START domain
MTQAQIKEQAVIAELEISSSPGKLFAAITDPEQLSQWWEGADHWEIDLRLGGKWRGWGLCDGKTSQVQGEFVEIIPPSTLLYTWVSDRRGEPSTVVRWDLQSQGRATLVTVTHSGFRKQDAQAMKGYATGWTEVLRGLRSFVYENANASFAARRDSQHSDEDSSESSNEDFS